MSGTVRTTVFENLAAPDLQLPHQGRRKERSTALQSDDSSAINKWHINMSNSEDIVLQKVRM